LRAVVMESLAELKFGCRAVLRCSIAVKFREYPEFAQARN
jgi:hypothetical protein